MSCILFLLMYSHGSVLNFVLGESLHALIVYIVYVHPTALLVISDHILALTDMHASDQANRIIMHTALKGVVIEHYSM